jgi:uncharacterized protein YdhG (YjbR/CyaY superfamily)
MRSAATTVDDYLAHQGDEWRPVLERLRAACLHHLAGYREAMAYGMPTYAKGDRPAIAFAKQAKYLSLYVMKKEVLDAHRLALRGLDVGKGCIRFVRPDQIDWELIETLLVGTAGSTADPC